MEYVRKKLDSGKTAGSVSFNFTSRNGNSEYWKLEAEAAGGVNVFGGLLIGTGKKSNLIVKKETTDSNSFLHLRFVKNIFPKFTSEFFVQNQDNHSSKLQQRILAGLGIRKTLIENDLTDFKIGIGLMSETEKLDGQDPTQLIRSTNYLSMTSKINNNLHFTSVLYIQPAFDNLEDVRLLLDFRPSVKISEHFSLSQKTILRFDALPPENVETLDYELVQMIEYHF